MPTRQYERLRADCSQKRLFDAVIEGRMLILSPLGYDSTKRHISRVECVEMNPMAEYRCNYLNAIWNS